MSLYRLKCGKHHANGVRYTKGDIVSSEEDLVANFGDARFEPVADNSTDVPSEPEVFTPPKSDKSSEFGEECTSEFGQEYAESCGITIFKADGWYKVINKDGELIGGKAHRKDEIAMVLASLSETE